MDFLTVLQTANRLGVTPRAVQKWAKEGKIKNAQKVGRDWMIPVDYAVNDTRVTNNEKIRKLNHVPFPMFQIPNIFYDIEKQIGEIEDEEERNITLCEFNYFKGELQKCSDIAELYLTSENLCWRLSSALFYTFANLCAGHMQKANFGADVLRRELEKIDLNDEEKARDNALIIFASVVLKTQLHIPFENTPPIEEHMKYMTGGMKVISCYLSAYKAYLAKDYSRSLGIAQTAMSCATLDYPISMIYLNIICAIDYINLLKTEKAVECILKAWEIAEPYKFYMPFVEHYSIFQGLLEHTIKRTHSEDYEKIISLTKKYNTSWYTVYNRRNQRKISDDLTPTEFTIAMLYSRGWRAKEIAAHMHISERTVSNYVQVIYEKLSINSRKDLEKFVLK